MADDKKKKADPLNKEMFQRSFENYMKRSSGGGFNGVWNPFIGLDDAIGSKLRGDRNTGGGGGGKKDDDGNGGGGDTGTNPNKGLYLNKSWPKVVQHYFPENSFKEGGLVRGGGQAQRGRGRGKMV